MSILSLNNVVKRYHNHTACDHITFDIPKGSIFGLLGPNGAGKTSLIRIITGITGADEGEIFFDGQKINNMRAMEIGYLPEERGLYKKMKVGEQLVYLARLKGLSPREAKNRINYWFEKFEITDWWNKKVEELSKGMQQKIQFIACVMHNPKLLILDEPFSGLDPINTNLIKSEIYELNQKGASIVFSTHRMEQVEEICEEIVLINQGKLVLHGKVDEIKTKFKENLYKVGFAGRLPSGLSNDSFSVVSDTEEGGLMIKIKAGHSSNELLAALLNKGIKIDSYHEVLPSLNEIFIKQVKGISYE